jgi:hypothetical protein
VNVDHSRTHRIGLEPRIRDQMLSVPPVPSGTVPAVEGAVLKDSWVSFTLLDRFESSFRSVDASPSLPPVDAFEAECRVMNSSFPLRAFPRASMASIIKDTFSYYQEYANPGYLLILRC